MCVMLEPVDREQFPVPAIVQRAVITDKSLTSTDHDVLEIHQRR